ncbi:MAG: DUF4301 family protein [Bacteroidales bacterium]|nr:DUF4301 family protein [Bacteroidales bacterium]
MFTENDILQIQSKGIDLMTIEMQIRNFEKGFPFALLVKPATIGDGIEHFSEKEISDLVKYYDIHKGNFKIIKFVPASGAASRMFKTLFNFLESPEFDPNDKSFNSVAHFIERLEDFAFFEDLKQIMSEAGIDLNEKLNNKEYRIIVDHLLTEKGLNYGNLPKGLLKFHRYESENRIPIEEHLVEAFKYANTEETARVHFTVSPEHMENFTDTVNKIKGKFEQKFKIIFEIDFSIQKSSTDTIAVDMKNKPFRNDDNSLLFRPAGHGALIENLNDLDGDIVFIKNIDNIVPDRLKPDTTKYKKAIGGLLLKLQEEVFKFLHELENESVTDIRLNEIIKFAEKKLYLRIPENFEKLSNNQKQVFLVRFLNRPIRVCGMVKNEGEPGGGPFWIKNLKGEVSLQIVESSQVDPNNPEQMKILQTATHFNPVDLVCGLKNYRGEPFDLRNYVDPETGFISVKSKDGKSLKAQELPGLWNGAMADWMTVFVEVPVITFNPVKTVNDLLRDQHQPD